MGEFPSVAPLTKAIAAAVVGIVSGVVAGIYRHLRPVGKTYTGVS